MVGCPLAFGLMKRQYSTVGACTWRGKLLASWKLGNKERGRRRLVSQFPSSLSNITLDLCLGYLSKLPLPPNSSRDGDQAMGPFRNIQILKYSIETLVWYRKHEDEGRRLSEPSWR